MSQIKKLHRIYNFIKDSDCVDEKIKMRNGYSNWITLAQSDDLIQVKIDFHKFYQE